MTTDPAPEITATAMGEAVMVEVRRDMGDVEVEEVEGSGLSERREGKRLVMDSNGDEATYRSTGVSACILLASLGDESLEPSILAWSNDSYEGIYGKQVEHQRQVELELFTSRRLSASAAPQCCFIVPGHSGSCKRRYKDASLSLLFLPPFPSDSIDLIPPRHPHSSVH